MLQESSHIQSKTTLNDKKGISFKMYGSRRIARQRNRKHSKGIHSRECWDTHTYDIFHMNQYINYWTYVDILIQLVILREFIDKENIQKENLTNNDQQRMFKVSSSFYGNCFEIQQRGQFLFRKIRNVEYLRLKIYEQISVREFPNLEIHQYIQIQQCLEIKSSKTDKLYFYLWYFENIF
ncbi:unnamed protein product (macronuclear) [Paramecium tetraurelia]|uniref:Uncharacterized protein n=1 Tax=Paramecium tetraurelia TaxID=5888 RepID=A0DMW3_PARTE|nr:uncharacterized protein GSPATT00018585001 [Paramecium tetraurelia]CAK84380.1 unnamed protein product [Paramecium tetraurelia]|eukprot:XP_001451777.1 hypothetical protein (macronuclear) [Paramecium tetraurelia strain d4-2]